MCAEELTLVAGAVAAFCACHAGIQESLFRAGAAERDKHHEKVRLRSKDTSRKKRKTESSELRDGRVMLTMIGGRAHGWE